MKNRKLLFSILIILFLVIYFFFINNNFYSHQTENNIKNNHWFYNLDKLDKNDDCVYKIIKQIEYFKNEKLSKLITFDKYKVSVFMGELKELDISSSDSARMFRTAIRYHLNDTDVNFAGHYTIVGVGMTGWGENYWIIDRKNGKAFEFPYQAEFIDFKKDSSLIIINPKDKILEFMKNSDNYHLDFCAEEIWLPKYYELRPSYVFWDDNKVKIIDNSKNIKPIISPFW
ncbi:MAG: hypothetical protein Q7K54_01600 [Candidatus Parcubacteria bacterium]|nr:hypothetical protein [Candidatus Parcubacteria bacterium]